LTYAVDGIQGIMLTDESLSDVIIDVAVLVVFAVVLIALATITLRRS
jgi:ABC-type multidrug transport system permease subunit